MRDRITGSRSMDATPDQRSRDDPPAGWRMLGPVRHSPARARPKEFSRQVTFSALSFAQVAEQRQDLPTCMDEMNSAEEFASLLDSEGSYGIQVVAPVAPADRESSKAFAGEKPRCQVGLHERADRHAGRQLPCRRTDAYEVVISLHCLVWNADLSGCTPHLRREHREKIEVSMTKREP